MQHIITRQSKSFLGWCIGSYYFLVTMMYYIPDIVTRYYQYCMITLSYIGLSTFWYHIQDSIEVYIYIYHIGLSLYHVHIHIYTCIYIIYTYTFVFISIMISIPIYLLQLYHHYTNWLGHYIPQAAWFSPLAPTRGEHACTADGRATALRNSTSANGGGTGEAERWVIIITLSHYYYYYYYFY